MDRFVVKRPPEEPGDNGKRPRPEEPAPRQPRWQEIRAEGLSCDYRLLFGKAEADEILRQLEEQVEYFEGEITKLHVFALDPSSEPYQRAHRFGHRTYFQFCAYQQVCLISDRIKQLVQMKSCLYNT
ncbi:DNA oxidative demethylase ALKBH2 isoform X2 [Strigops habroptila]|uniref:DNA oxidative demethylase ALKBH2 isoform X2 n=1 Tax=Strigops habroptila TaxID=2489341 RepID=UPI0011CF7458|nr:DNA oxidative demethylase ALKBH2 isoform X2 [Strigops habroptila]